MDDITAIYEGGVFKPVGEVSLPEKTEVRISLPEVPRDMKADDVVAKQQAAWRALFSQIESDPDLARSKDSFSGADHDEVLYGGQDGPA